MRTISRIIRFLGGAVLIAAASAAFVSAARPDVFFYSVSGHVADGTVYCEAMLEYVEGDPNEPRELTVTGHLVNANNQTLGSTNFLSSHYYTPWAAEYGDTEHSADVSGTWHCYVEFYVDNDFKGAITEPIVVP